MQDKIYQIFSDLLSEIQDLNNSILFANEATSICLLKSSYEGKSIVKLMGGVPNYEKIYKIFKLSAVV